MVVAILIDRGAAGPGVKTAIAELRQRHGHDWPLSYSDLASAGRTIVVVDEPLTDIARGQQSQVYEADLVRVRDSLRNGGWAAEKTGATHIEVDPDRLSGRPAIRGRRMAVEDTARIAETRGGRELLKDGYDLTDEEIDDAVAWWEAARRLEQAA